MTVSITHRQATVHDLRAIVSLLIQDKLGSQREQLSDTLDPRYLDAFHRIQGDPNQYLMVTCTADQIIGTCHLTLLPSLTFIGSTRMQIEAVRVHPNARGQGVGRQMIEHAMRWGKTHGATIVQLSTHKKRPDALRLYQAIGFEATHEGLKWYDAEAHAAAPGDWEHA